MQRTAEPTQGRIRLHLDLRPVDGDVEVEVEAEVDRLLGFGARHADVGQTIRSWCAPIPKATSSAFSAASHAGPDRQRHSWSAARGQEGLHRCPPPIAAPSSTARSVRSLCSALV
ncbi:MAG: hypothetical protein M3Y44_14595 [Actinomycetota bacterium]|nr:hypothetical protein [Actinomycetota bacterium]